jgi:TatA/E family protein of Tat protein translocase
VFHPSLWHLVILLAVVLLVLGPKRLPQMARSLGGALRDFRGAMDDDTPEQKTREALVEARQEPPAPTPEIAEAEIAAEREPSRPAV